MELSIKASEQILGGDSGLNSLISESIKKNPFKITADKTPEELEYSDISMLDKLQTAFRDDSFIYQGGSAIYRKQFDKSFEFDESFNEQRKNDLLKDIPLRDDLKNNILDRAKNEEHFRTLVDDSLKFQRELEALDKSTWNGFFYRGTALTTDLLPILASAPVSIGGRIVLSSSPIRRFATGAVYDGAIELAKRELGERDRTAMELVTAPLLGGLANSMFGARFAVPKELKESTEQMIRLNTNMSKKDVEKVNQLIKEEKIDEANAVFKQKLKDNKIEEAKADNLFDMVLSNNKVQNMSSGAYNKLRGDLTFMLQHSQSPTMSRFAKEYFEDPMLRTSKNGDETTGNTLDKLYGSRTAIEIRDALTTAYQEEFNEINKNWYKAFVETGEKKNKGEIINGLFETFSDSRELLYHYAGKLHLKRSNNIDGFKDKTKALKWISDELVENLNFKRDTAENLGKSMMDATEKIAEKQHDILNLFGAKKFQDGTIPKDKLYATNIYRKGAMDDLRYKGLSDEQIGDYLARSYVNGLMDNAGKAGDLSRISKLRNKFELKINSKNEDFDKLKYAMLGFIKSSTGDNVGAVRNLRNQKVLKEEVLDDLLSANFKDNQEVLDLLFPQGRTEVKGSEQVIFQKHRKAFDRAYTRTYTTKDGREARITFDELLETNLDSIYTQYSKKMSGRTSLERTTGKVAFNEDGNPIKKEFDLETEEQVENMFLKIQEEINSQSIPQHKKASEIARVRHTFLQMMGEPTIENPFAQTHQLVDIMNNMTIGLKLGAGALPMIAEYTNIVMRFGAKEFLQNADVGKDIQKILTTGKVPKGLAQDMYNLLSIGRELGEGHFSIRQEANMSPFSTANILKDKTGTTVDNFLNTAHNFSSKFASATLLLSGMKPLHAFGQAVFGSTIVNRFLAKKVDKQLLREMNISKDMAKRISKQFEKHSTRKTLGDGTTQVKEMNANNWDDTEAFITFRHGIKRVVDTYMQRGHLGDELGVTLGSQLLSDTWYGRMFLNLKNYMIVSYTKQLGRTVHNFDKKQSLTMATQIAMVSNLVYAQAVMNNIGNKEKMEKALEPEEFGLNVLKKTSFASYVPEVFGFGEVLSSGSSGYSNTLPVWVLNQFPQMATLKDLTGIFRVPYNIASGKYDAIGKDAVNLTVNHPIIQPARNYAKTIFEKQRKERVNLERQKENQEKKLDDFREKFGL